MSGISPAGSLPSSGSGGSPPLTPSPLSPAPSVAGSATSVDGPKYRIKRQPQYGVYGFIMWLTTLVCYIVFLLWAFTPEQVLHSAGIWYYPDRYWAIALPSWLSVTFFFLVISYVMLYHIKTAPLDSIYTYTDQFARGESKVVQDLTGKKPIPPVSDIPIVEVNHILFGHLTRRKRRWNSTITG
eukprot:ANDGO_04824.mRNA.1 Phosphatidylinositol N-acetylglucosaminyltransferase subunit P